jgi:predicted DNA-binding transcriptional regulator YafY
MKYEIMIGILIQLLGKKCVSAKYLAEKFGVSVRSIYRYIDAIDAAGVPIYTVRGNNGGFSIVDTYKLPSTFLTKKEYDVTINALTGLSDALYNTTLQNVIDKLKAVCKTQISGFDISSGNLIIDGGSWGDTNGYKLKLQIIQQAIESGRKLLINYHDRNGSKTERIIEPHIVVFKQGLWYVYAFCHLRQEFRFFKTGRIEYANLLSETFERRPIKKEDLPFDYWHDSVIAEEVVMEISTEILSDIQEWVGVENISIENGKHVARVSLPYEQGLITKIMSFGAGIKVISPQKLIDSQKEFAKTILENYKEI